VKRWVISLIHLKISPLLGKRDGEIRRAPFTGHRGSGFIFAFAIITNEERTVLKTKNQRRKRLNISQFHTDKSHRHPPENSLFCEPHSFRCPVTLKHNPYPSGVNHERVWPEGLIMRPPRESYILLGTFVFGEMIP